MTAAQMELAQELRLLLPSSTPSERDVLRDLVNDPLVWWTADPAQLMTDSGMRPDPWQAALLRSSHKRKQLLSSRQVGKSRTVSNVALKQVLLRPDQFVVIVSRSEKQAVEMFREHLLPTWKTLGYPLKVRQPTKGELRLGNGGRILILAHSPDTDVGKSGVHLLIIDEASRVSDEMYAVTSPFLATTDGDLILLSSPNGKIGFFWRAWDEEADVWERTRVTAAYMPHLTPHYCPRISPAFLDKERRSKGERWYRQEYETSFEDAEGAAFSQDAIDAAISVGGVPLFH